MNPLLESALALARRNLPVFQVTTAVEYVQGRYACSCGKLRCDRPAKHPDPRYAPNGLENATTNEALIAWWWDGVPTANVGLATGRVIVLDVDPRHGGDESLKALEAQHGPLPLTWRSLTGGGGEHVFFAPPPGAEIRNDGTGKVGPGLDIRGAGGYVVAPPSLHISGRRYAWSVDHHPDDVPLAPLPKWISAALAKPDTGPAAVAQQWRDLALADAREGQRNATVTKLTGHLLRRYIDPLVAHELVQAWNATHCRPPLEPDEVTRTVDSIAKKEFQRREAQIGRR